MITLKHLKGYTSLYVIWLVLVMDMLFVVSLHNKWHTGERKYLPLKEHVEASRTTLATGHLWLEEAISGDKNIIYKRDVLPHFEAVILNNQKLKQIYEKSVKPPEEEHLIEKLISLDNDFETIRAAVQKRWTDPKHVVGSALDEAFDKMYNQLQEKLKNFSTEINTFVKADHNKHNSYAVNIVLIFFVINMIVFSILFNARRVNRKLLKILKDMNGILSVISNVNQDIIKIKDQDLLVEKICMDLTENHNFYSTWIALSDTNGYVYKVSGNGFGEAFSTFKEKLLNGYLPYCMEHINQQEFLDVEGVSSVCRECALKDSYPENSAIILKIEHQGENYGYMGISIPKEYLQDEHVNRLLLEVAEDIAFALYNISREKVQKESENLFRLLYEKSPLAYQSLDNDGNIKVINEKWCEELGYTEAEVIGKNFGDFLAPGSQENFKENFPLFKAAGSIDIEFDMVRKDGTIITVMMTGKIVNDQQEHFLQSHCIFTNITERLRIQNELKFNKDYLQSLFDVTPNIMFTTDGESIDHVNPSLLKFFGYEKKEDFAREHNCISDFFLGDKESLRPVMGGMRWLEYVLSKPDELHKVCIFHEGKKHYFIVSAEAFNLQENYHSLVTFTDVTELEEIRERFVLAVYGAKDGLWDWDLKTDKVYFSPPWKAMLGYKDDEILNILSEWSKRVHPDDLEAALKDVKASHAKPGVPYRNIHRLRHRDGHWLWILDRGQTIFDESGKAVRMVGYHTDISEQKALEDELRVSKNQFDLFMENISASIVIKDSSEHILYANAAAARFLGRENLVGLTAYDVT